MRVMAGAFASLSADRRSQAQMSAQMNSIKVYVYNDFTIIITSPMKEMSLSSSNEVKPTVIDE